ncbi:hypothetical protein ACP4OV_025997 [Aristida adscensionis]
MGHRLVQPTPKPRGSKRNRRPTSPGRERVPESCVVSLVSRGGGGGGGSLHLPGGGGGSGVPSTSWSWSPTSPTPCSWPASRQRRSPGCPPPGVRCWDTFASTTKASFLFLDIYCQQVRKQAKKSIADCKMIMALSKMDSRTKDQLRKWEDEDDEIMFCILPALLLLGGSGSREKRPRHVSMLPGKERFKETLEGHEKNCCHAFHMEPNIFRAIANYLRMENLLRDTRGVEVEKQFGFFMYMLSHNASFEDLQHEFKHSGETIHRHIKAVFNIIPALTTRFVRPANNPETHWKISTGPRFFLYFESIEQLPNFSANLGDHFLKNEMLDSMAD